jgi:hypothetical protein
MQLKLFGAMTAGLCQKSNGSDLDWGGMAVFWFEPVLADLGI